MNSTLLLKTNKLFNKKEKEETNNDILYNNHAIIRNSSYTIKSDDNIRCNDKYVCIELNGGLGNNLFQLAFIYSIAQKYNKTPTISLIIKNTHKTIEYNFIKKFIYDRFVKYNTIIEEKECNWSTYINYSLNSNYVKFKGFFQNEKYFKLYLNGFLSKCDLFNNIDLSKLSIYKPIDKYFIHVRRTDFITDKLHNIDLDIYYQNCINYLIKNTIHKIIFLVFSDDIEYCKTCYLFQNNTKTGFEFVEGLNEIESLYLMSKCYLGGICPNSTFSWWGAYLNQNKNKQIFFPDRWLNNSYPVNIYPDSCFIMSVSELNTCDLDSYKTIVIQDTNKLKNILIEEIYNTQYYNTTLRNIDIIYNLLIEGEHLLQDKYDMSIVMPVYNRHEYLKITLESLKIANTNIKTILFIIDDGSDDIETIDLLHNFHLSYIPIVKIFFKRIKLDNNFDGANTLLPGSSYPFSIKFFYDVSFRINSKYTMNLDSDVIVNNNFIDTAYNFCNTITDKYFIVSGFKACNSHHKIKEEYDTYYISDSVGGINIIFNKDTYCEFICNNIYDYAYDWKITEHLKKHNIKIYIIKNSIIQHIGISPVIIRGFDNINKYINHTYMFNFNQFKNICYDTNNIMTQRLYLLICDYISKKTNGHINADDFKLGSSCLNTLVDKIYIINLEHRADRYDIITQNLKHHDITNYIRFNAIKPTLNNYSQEDLNNFITNQNTTCNFLLDYNYLSYNKLNFSYIKSTNGYINYIRGIVGCKASHIEVIKQAREKLLNSILILEDDIKFIEFYEIHLLKAILYLQSNNDFDMLYLTCNNSEPYTDINDVVIKPNYSLSASGYIIKKSMYDYIINNAMNSGQEIDVFYANLQKLNKFKIYSIKPNIINQLQSMSDIENKIVDYSLNVRTFTTHLYDIIYIVHSKDKYTLIKSIDTVRKYLFNYNRIFIVAKDNFMIHDTNINFICEDKYAFTKEQVINLLKSKKCPENKYGWFYQQLLKLYVWTTTSLTPHFLVLDSDTIIHKSFNFFNEDNIPYFTVGHEYNKPYFEHMSRLLPMLHKQINKSGIAHHMMLSQNILNNLFNDVYNIHKQQFWYAFLDCITFDNTRNFSRASEFEIYFNYVLKYYSINYEIRQIDWANMKFTDYIKYIQSHGDKYYFIACHDYMIHGDENLVII